MFQNYQHPRRVVPATIMIVIAALLVFALYFEVRDRFLDPQIKTTEQAGHSTTGIAAQRAGAKLSPTEPKLSVEPKIPKPSNQPITQTLNWRRSDKRGIT